MKLHLNNRPNCMVVQACVVAPGDADAGVDAGAEKHARHRLRIDDVWYQQSVILTPAAVELWEVDSAAALTAAHFERLASTAAEVVILGTGARAIFAHASLTQALMKRRIGLEVMDTPAACRTYNILAADGRQVVAGLIA